jgi:hypothetical protein
MGTKSLLALGLVLIAVALGSLYLGMVDSKPNVTEARLLLLEERIDSLSGHFDRVLSIVETHQAEILNQKQHLSEQQGELDTLKDAASTHNRAIMKLVGEQ